MPPCASYPGKKQRTPQVLTPPVGSTYAATPLPNRALCVLEGLFLQQQLESGFQTAQNSLANILQCLLQVLTFRQATRQIQALSHVASILIPFDYDIELRRSPLMRSHAYPALTPVPHPDNPIPPPGPVPPRTRAARQRGWAGPLASPTTPCTSCPGRKRGKSFPSQCLQETLHQLCVHTSDLAQDSQRMWQRLLPQPLDAQPEAG